MFKSIALAASAIAMTAVPVAASAAPAATSSNAASKLSLSSARASSTSGKSSKFGGPSAGLLFSLGIIDLVEGDSQGGDLTDGRTIAGTGSIAADGTVDISFTYRDGSFDGAAKEMKSRGFVESPSGAVWGIRFVWPIKADYRVSHVAEDYSTTVITREKRDYVWIMARTKALPEAELQRLIDFAVRQGYDAAKIERMPQR